MKDMIWIVVQQQGDKVDAHAFTKEADANNYAEEMSSCSGSSCPAQSTLTVVSTVLNRRRDLTVEEGAWGVEVPDVNSNFVEGLLLTMNLEAEDKHSLVEQFMHDRSASMSEDMTEMVKEYVMEELKDYLENEDTELSCED